MYSDLAYSSARLKELATVQVTKVIAENPSKYRQVPFLLESILFVSVDREKGVVSVFLKTHNRSVGYINGVAVKNPATRKPFDLNYGIYSAVRDALNKMISVL